MVAGRVGYQTRGRDRGLRGSQRLTQVQTIAPAQEGVRAQPGAGRGRAEQWGRNSPDPSPSPRPRCRASPSSPAGSFVPAPCPPLRVSGSASSEPTIGPPSRWWAGLRVAEARYIVKVGRAPSANFSARGRRARVCRARAPLLSSFPVTFLLVPGRAWQRSQQAEWCSYSLEPQLRGSPSPPESGRSEGRTRKRPRAHR